MIIARKLRDCHIPRRESKELVMAKNLILRKVSDALLATKWTFSPA